MLCYVILYYTTLYYIIPYDAMLYYNILQYSMNQYKFYCITLIYHESYIFLRHYFDDQYMFTLILYTIYYLRDLHRREILCIDYLVPLCIPISMLGDGDARGMRYTESMQNSFCLPYHLFKYIHNIIHVY